MKVLLTLALGVQLMASSASADNQPHKLLVIAADHSWSMVSHGQPDWRHIRIQETAMKTVFDSPHNQCGEVTVVYFAWSHLVHEGIYTLDLGTDDNSAFLLGISNLASILEKRGTTHSAPFYQASAIFEQYPDYEHYLLVTTDEPGKGQNLTNVVPDATVFAVTYTEAAAEYAINNLVTNQWNVLLATDAEEAIVALTTILNEVIAEVCAGV